MIYRVLYSRFDPESKSPMLVEDLIEASHYHVTDTGALTLCCMQKQQFKDEDFPENMPPDIVEQIKQQQALLEVPFFAVPGGAWIMIEAADLEAERQKLADTPMRPSGSILIPR